MENQRCGGVGGKIRGKILSNGALIQHGVRGWKVEDAHAQKGNRSRWVPGHRSWTEKWVVMMRGK